MAMRSPFPVLLLVCLFLASCDLADLGDGDYGTGGGQGPVITTSIDLMAAGGSMVVGVDGDAVLSVEEGPFVVTEIGREGTHRTFLLTAESAGRGALRVSNGSFSPPPTSVAALDVETIETRPANDYGWDGVSEFAIPYEHPELDVVLLASGGQQLRDDSLSLDSGEGVAQIEGNRFLVRGLGRIPFAVAGDSFGARALEAYVEGSADRVDVVAHPPQWVGANNQIEQHTVCFYAFNGERQVVAPIDISVVGPATEWGSPCSDIRPTGSGDVIVQAIVLDQVVTHLLER